MKSDPLKIWIPHTFPAMNEIIAASKVRRGSWSRYADVKGKCTEVVKLYALQHRQQRIEAAHFSFEWHVVNRRHDPDNIAAGSKFVLDGLVAAGVITGDGFKHVLSIHHSFRVSKQTGVMVTITEAKNDSP